MQGREDLRPAPEGLRDCRLPVAARPSPPRRRSFPASLVPLNLVCPLTEFSAEFQAIAFALENPQPSLSVVDRSADLVFQWMPPDDDAVERAIPNDPEAEAEDEEAAMHGSAVGIEVGSLMPRSRPVPPGLAQKCGVRYFSEWWDQYVEEAIIEGDYAAYRQVMFLVGSLFRRLGTTESDRRSNELRERHMWTRIKKHLIRLGIDPRDAIYR